MSEIIKTKAEIKLSIPSGQFSLQLDLDNILEKINRYETEHEELPSALKIKIVPSFQLEKIFDIPVIFEW